MPLSHIGKGVRHALSNTRLPWSTVVSTGLASLVGGLLGRLIGLARVGAVVPDQSLGPCVLDDIWGGVVMGGAIVIADRVRRARPRWAAWAVAGALAALVPVPSVMQVWLRPGGEWQVYFPLLVWLPVQGLTGGALGWAAQREDGVLWRLPLAAIGAQLAVPVLAFALGLLYYAATGRLGEQKVDSVALAHGLLSTCVGGGLLGLAVGERLAFGRRG
jgi:hypothetical protein